MRLRYAIPVLLLLGVLVLFAFGLRLDPTRVPSPLIGKPAPTFELPVVTGEGSVLTTAALRGRPHLVNFWASWCPPCLQEHPMLLEISRRGVSIVGISYKDDDIAARAWLARHGNPFSVVAADRDGRAGLDWGVYGAPETYVVDAQGVIRYKHIGPVTPDDWRGHLAPALEQAATR